MCKDRIEVTEEHLDFLDDLRMSGTTNMFDAGSYVMDEFEVSAKDSAYILKIWMNTFSERQKRKKTS